MKFIIYFSLVLSCSSILSAYATHPPNNPTTTIGNGSGGGGHGGGNYGGNPGGSPMHDEERAREELRHRREEQRRRDEEEKKRREIEAERAREVAEWNAKSQDQQMDYFISRVPEMRQELEYCMAQNGTKVITRSCFFGEYKVISRPGIPESSSLLGRRGQNRYDQEDCLRELIRRCEREPEYRSMPAAIAAAASSSSSSSVLEPIISEPEPYQGPYPGPLDDPYIPPFATESIASDGSYSFTSSSHYVDQLKPIYDGLSRVNPQTERQSHAKDLGLKAVQNADQAFTEQEFSEGYIYKDIAEGLLSIAIDANPTTGFGRSVYELYTGENLITGERLTRLEMGFAFLGVATAGTSSAILHTSETLVKFAHHALTPRRIHAVEKAYSSAKQFLLAAPKNATVIRNSPGRAYVSQKLSQPDILFKGTHAQAALVPKSVAEQLSGEQFSNFDQFRKAFWKAMHNSPYAEAFTAQSSKNLAFMSQGKAPVAFFEQHVGRNNLYELHHLKAIEQGGAVYDMGNLVIVSPAFHHRMLHNKINSAAVLK